MSTTVHTCDCCSECFDTKEKLHCHKSEKHSIPKIIMDGVHISAARAEDNSLLCPVVSCNKAVQGRSNFQRHVTVNHGLEFENNKRLPDFDLITSNKPAKGPAGRGA